MTVFDASISLYGWFAENDSFTINQYLDICGDKAKGLSAEEIKASLLCGLDQLEKIGLISKTIVGKKTIWVLDKNYITVDQDVKISADTALLISEVINNFCDMLDDHGDQCNPIAISEKDIKNLIHISTFYMTKK